jgi:hypothetical protein
MSQSRKPIVERSSASIPLSWHAPRRRAARDSCGPDRLRLRAARGPNPAAHGKSIALERGTGVGHQKCPFATGTPLWLSASARIEIIQP